MSFEALTVDLLKPESLFLVNLKPMSLEKLFFYRNRKKDPAACRAFATNVAPP